MIKHVSLGGFASQQTASISLRNPNSVGITLPLLINIGHEGALPPLNVGLHNAIVACLVAHILDLLAPGAVIHEPQVGLQLEAPWLLVSENDLSHALHCFINLRVVIEELLGSVVVRNALVDVQLVKEVLQCREAMCTNPLPGDVHSEHFLAFCRLVELKGHQFGVALAHSSEYDISGPHVRLTERILRLVVEEKGFNTLVQHLEPARVVDIIPVLSLVGAYNSIVSSSKMLDK